MRSPTGIKRFIGLLMGGLLAALSSAVFSESTVTPGSKASGMDACVAPSEEMRRYHMLYLKHDRVETVRKGVRGLKYSLSDCVDCHAAEDEKGGYQPVDAEGQFCDSCHNVTAVTLACFQCHRTTPEGDEVSSITNSGNEIGGGDRQAYGLLLDIESAAGLTADELARLHAKVQED